MGAGHDEAFDGKGAEFDFGFSDVEPGEDAAESDDEFFGFPAAESGHGGVAELVEDDEGDPGEGEDEGAGFGGGEIGGDLDHEEAAEEEGEEGEDPAVSRFHRREGAVAVVGIETFGHEGEGSGGSSASPPAVAAAFEASFGDEIGWAFFDPADEFGDCGVGLEGIDGGEVLGEFGLGEEGVDFTVADGVEDGDGAAFAAFELGGEVMFGFRVGVDLALAERADLHGERWTFNFQGSTFKWWSEVVVSAVWLRFGVR